MRLIVNGKELDTEDGISIKELLDKMGISVRPFGFAVSVNEEIVSKNKYEEYRLKEGDRVEIVKIVGGG
ncbi:MAG: sulfur carrier protein ThiS [Aquificaceae bacterium]|nr:sulfur carrier protein ThiS [Aquificaceae bacterium]